MGRLISSIAKEENLIKSSNKKSFIERSRDFQNHLEEKWIQKKQQKKKNYQEFLDDPDRKLPSLKVIILCRNIIILIMIIIISIPAYMILFYFDTCFVCIWKFETYQGWVIVTIPFLCCMINIVLTGWAAAFDYAIFKRFGIEKAFAPWIL